MKKVFLIWFFLIGLLPSLVQALEVPPLRGQVNDYAGMISPATRESLEGELKAFEQTDSTQLVILTISTLESEPIENFSIKVGETWKIGQKGKDNGIIMVVAKQERKIRIEVGRGLEGRLTDLMAGRIVDQVMKPKFKTGDFDGGFQAGTSALIDATRGEFKAVERQPSKNKGAPSFLTFLIAGFVALLFMGTLSRTLGGIAGFVGLPALLHWGLFPLGLVTLILAALAGLGIGLSLPSLFSGGRGGGFWPGGFFPTGGGGGWGGGDSGGGFSGGGGDFGGGGASGDW